jgi:hypothetical protein
LTKLADGLWGPGKVAPARIGRGRLHFSVERAIETGDLEPDVATGGHDLHWVHRAMGDTDIYFISNQLPSAFAGNVRFRIGGRHVEIWDAVDGSRTPAAYAAGDRTTEVQLALAPYSSKFLLFRAAASPGGARIETRQSSELATLEGPWDVRFIDGQDAPRNVRLAGAWTDHENPAMRHYSGRAAYTGNIAVRGEWLRDQRIELDLGDVRELARVLVNGVDQGVWWTAPFRRDITDALRAGDNRLEIIVTNYWANRLIGDEQPGATRFTFAPIRPYSADSPLRPSGLLGPVRLLGITPGKTP